MVRAVEAKATSALLEMGQGSSDASQRLNALLALHAVGALSDEVAKRALTDPDECVRGWAVQLLTDRASFRRADSPSAKPPIGDRRSEDTSIAPALLNEFVRLANTDPSPVVRLYLASAIQRVPQDAAWPLIEALAQHAEDRDDRNLPLLLWQGLSEFNQPDARLPGRTHAIATGRLRLWYAYFRGRGLNRVVSLLDKFDGETLRRRLAEWNWPEFRFNIPMPGLEIRRGETHASEDSRIQRRRTPGRGVRRRLMFPRLRDTLADAAPFRPENTCVRRVSRPRPSFDPRVSAIARRRGVSFYDDHLACSLDSPAIAERC